MLSPPSAPSRPRPGLENCLVSTEDGKYISALCDEGTIFQTISSSLQYNPNPSFDLPKAEVHYIAQPVYIGVSEGLLYLINLETGKQVQNSSKLHFRTKSVTADSDLIAIAGADGVYLTTYNAETLSTSPFIPVFGTVGYCCLKVALCEQYIAVAGIDARIALWARGTAKSQVAIQRIDPLKQLPVGDCVTDMRFCDHGNSLIVAWWSGCVVGFEIKEDQLVQKWVLWRLFRPAQEAFCSLPACFLLTRDGMCVVCRGDGKFAFVRVLDGASFVQVVNTENIHVKGVCHTVDDSLMLWLGGFRKFVVMKWIDENRFASICRTVEEFDPNGKAKESTEKNTTKQRYHSRRKNKSNQHSSKTKGNNNRSKGNPSSSTA